ncbi:hypothetical protein [Alkalibacillus haloalkaliphilus]|uniref:hypothetical protein n=1 Tax=Alkalibacillus haloalkaliphilus TaxID=94136 RepID=UPI0029354244|nr:hypothetical protein [Alkalibacillus haloalkaliphilus]MDV2582957.1 hypothetical protein [Alkalibacillus haloalkaliphilus]
MTKEDPALEFLKFAEKLQKEVDEADEKHRDKEPSQIIVDKFNENYGKYLRNKK